MALKSVIIERKEHTGPTFGHLKGLGRLGRGQEQICLVCSATFEAFGAARTLSAPIQHAKSEEVGCRPSEPLDSLIGDVLAIQRGVWESGILCALSFSVLSVPSFPVFMFWSTGMRLDVMTVQDELICVRLVMPRCMFSMQKVHASVELAARRSSVFKCNFIADRVRQEATEWSDKGSWLLVWVWAVCGGLNRIKQKNKTKDFCQ